MSTVLGIWHLVLEGGKVKTIHTPAGVQITNVSYGEEIVDTASRDVVKLSFESLATSDNEDDDEEEKEDEDIPISTTVLCVLTPGKTEQTSVNVVLDSDAAFKFETTGKNTIYLTGNYISQDDDRGVDSEDEYDSDDEDAYDLREVSSDVEMHPDDLDSDNSRFEEVDDEEVEQSKSQKRARDSDATEVASKVEKKNKKQKAEGGKAVAVPAEAAGPTEKKDKKKKEKSADEAKKPAEGKESHPKKTIAGGVVIQDAKIGTGPMAKKGNHVRMRYVGKLTNGKIFDKNTSGKPFAFHLGKGEVIKGWDEGIAGMQVGGERVLTIPPNMGYGSKKSGPIPPNSTLIFEVKLLEIK
ncbi:hypothetical protein BDN70DRAFT_830782 [Pholiota conissans]|uniref:peptidylprolyl isomerase n=1 Tax=Pholiota conissans TaxID=109636 RepID=A0A9P6D2X0_9AGAR|nr:hypothetical protein BDN70DRAFT_830782 [Pholiota conissans]